MGSTYKQGTTPARHCHLGLKEYPVCLPSQPKRKDCPTSPMSQMCFFPFLVPLANTYRCSGHAVKEHGLWAHRVIILGVNNVGNNLFWRWLKVHGELHRCKTMSRGNSMYKVVWWKGDTAKSCDNFWKTFASYYSEGSRQWEKLWGVCKMHNAPMYSNVFCCATGWQLPWCSGCE